MGKVLYIVLNKELKMSAGKAAAQAVHAAMMLQETAKNFADDYKRTVIVLEAENSEQIRSLEEYLDRAEIFCQKYIDEGVNEVSAYSVTALAVEPIDEDNEELRGIFEPFRLFSGRNYIEEDRASSAHMDALNALVAFSRDFQGYDGMEPVDKTPRAIRKAIAWLRKH